MELVTGYERLSDEELLAVNKATVSKERSAVVAMLRQLAEIDRRRLHVAQGYSSLFLYCVRGVGLSESASWRRVQACRAAKRYPVLFWMLRRGKLHASTLALLAPHLRDDNWRSLVRQASGKSRRDVERLLASLQGEPERRDRVRHIGPAQAQCAQAPQQGDGAGPGLFDPALSATPSPASERSEQGEAVGPEPPERGSSSGGGADFSDGSDGSNHGEGAARRDGLAAAASGPAGGGSVESVERRVEISFAADEGFLRRLERARELMRHRIAGARFEHVLSAALDAWLDRKDPERRLRRKAERELKRRSARRADRDAPGERDEARPDDGSLAGDETPAGNEVRTRTGRGARSRYIPQMVKDEVYRRDGGRCTFVSASGGRCEARAALEFDHIVPFAMGGSSEDPGNIRLRCRAHNGHAARRAFGPAFVDAAIAAERAARAARARPADLGPGVGPEAGSSGSPSGEADGPRGE